MNASLTPHRRRRSAARRCSDRPAGRRCCPAGRRPAAARDRRQLDVALHEVDPHRQRGGRAGLAVADRLLLVVADPDADRDVRIEADEPRVGVVVHGAGLAGERPVERVRGRARAALHDAAQQVGHHEGGVGADRIARLRAAFLEQRALAVGDRRRQERLHADAVIRKRRVGAGELDQRRFLRAERHRQERAEVLREAELLGIGGHLRGPSISMTLTAGMLRDCSSARRSVIVPMYLRS